MGIDRDHHVIIFAPIGRDGPACAELLSSANSEDRMKMYASMTPLGRLGQAEDIAGVVVFLATDEAGWVNGQTIRVNGGLVA